MPPRKRKGNPVTIADRHIEQITTLIRAGLTWPVAAKTIANESTSGVSIRTLYLWRQLGMAERDRRAEGLAPDPYRDEHVRFIEAVERAVAEGESNLVARIQQIARGGDPRRITTTTRVVGGRNGNSTTTKVTEEVFRPEWTAAAWLLERHPEYSQRWRRKDRVDVHVDQGELLESFAEVVTAICDAPEIGLTAEQQTALRAVLADRLRKLRPAGV